MYVPESQPASTESLPTMYDLPSESPEEPGLPDEFHGWQARLLSDTCCPPTYPTNRVFTAIDLNLYYDANHLNWYKRPDWFLVVDVPKFYQEQDLRLSYVIWQEQVSPLAVVELLSPGTEDEDLGLTEQQPNQPPTKWRVYERILKVPYYFVFSRYNNELRVFRLVNRRYREQILTEPRFWIPELELGIGLWFGSYQDNQRRWLRWYDADGNLIPTPEERERQAKEAAMQRAEQEQQAKEAAMQQTEQERQAKEAAIRRAEILAERLREMGINPDQL